MPARYVMFTMSVHDEDADLVMAVLSGYPIVGVEQGLDSLLVCFEQNDWQAEYADAIRSELATMNVRVHGAHVQVVEDRNWNAEWEASIEPVIVNERIIIVPEWRTEEFPHPLRLVITPKMSFGTGHHATTRMMCQLLEQYVQPGSRWIDVGTGTGVLAILAARLGAEYVYAFDNDEWSYVNSQENILRNDVTDAIHLEHTDLQNATLPLSSGLAANLYRHLVIPHAKAFVESVQPGGVLLLSGILRYDADDVTAPFLELGCRVEELRTETEWCAIALRTGGIQ